MAVAYQTNFSDYSSGTSLVLTKPSGVADGDLILAVVCWYYGGGSNTAPTAPGGFTALTQVNGNSSAQAIKCFWKIAASEGSSYTFTVGAGTTYYGALIRISGTHQTSPIDANASNTAAPSGASYDAPAATAVTAAGLLVTIVNDQGNGATGTSWTNSVTSMLNNKNAACSIRTGYKTLSASGSTGTSTLTLAGNPTYAVAQSLVIAPPAAAASSYGFGIRVT